MKIYGIGTDITNTQRISKSIKNKKFLKKLFNNIKIIKCEKQINKTNCYAKRFAAKEAFSKALGTGISGGINLKEIIVENTSSGKPKIRLLGKTKDKVKKIIKKKKYNIYLSLSDEKQFAVANVIISA